MNMRDACMMIELAEGNPCMHVHGIYIYIGLEHVHIYKERERERERLGAYTNNRHVWKMDHIPKP